MKTRITTLLSTLALSLTLCAAAQASLVTFDLATGGSTVTLSSFSQTVSGVTLNLLNPSPSANFKFDGDGVYLASNEVLSFNLTVTGATLLFQSYTMTYSSGAHGGSKFDLSGGTGASSNNPLDATGNFTANGNWTLAPGQTGTLTTSLVGVDALAQIHTMTFDASGPAAVPEPSTYALLCISLGVVGYARKRMAKSAAVAAVVA